MAHTEEMLACDRPNALTVDWMDNDRQSFISAEKQGDNLREKWTESAELAVKQQTDKEEIKLRSNAPFTKSIEGKNKLLIAGSKVEFSEEE